MTNQTLHLIASRRSHRAYKPGQISPEQLEALMTAALQSPSAMDRQPWHFSFVQDKELLKRVTRAAHEQAALLEEAQRSPRFASPPLICSIMPRLWYLSPLQMVTPQLTAASPRKRWHWRLNPWGLAA